MPELLNFCNKVAPHLAVIGSSYRDNLMAERERVTVSARADLPNRAVKAAELEAKITKFIELMMSPVAEVFRKSRLSSDMAGALSQFLSSHEPSLE